MRKHSIAVFVLCWSWMAMSQSGEMRISALQGDAALENQDGGAGRALTLGTVVGARQVLALKENGQAALTTPDGTVVSLQGQSRMVIGQNEATLSYGNLSVRQSKASSASPLVIQTPRGTVSASDEGARFDVVSLQDGTTRVECRDGDVAFQIQDMTIQIGAQQKVQVRQGKDGNIRLKALAGEIVCDIGGKRVQLQQNTEASITATAGGKTAVSVVSGSITVVDPTTGTSQGIAAGDESVSLSPPAREVPASTGIASRLSLSKAIQTQIGNKLSDAMETNQTENIVSHTTTQEIQSISGP